MWITGTSANGTSANMVHCQHVNPKLWWIEFSPGKPPQYAYTGFPHDGQVVLSKDKVIVLCRRCAPQIDTALDELRASGEL